ncbi:MAG: acetate--CoA ligase family protein [Gammaproteobacteria bacterium]|nr:acetate--CoA ligase family protein [Gammaproteobacteria bacterium]
MHALAPLFLPKSVALVGASPDKRNFRGRLVSALLRHRTDAPIYFVSPSHKEIEGVECHVTVRQIPEQVDLAIVAIPAAAVTQVMEECGQAGVKAVVIVSSGFADENTQAGKARQEQIKSICLKHGMLLLGPNSEGILNTGLPLAASFSAAVANGEHHGDKFEAGQKGIALVSQSGGLGFGIYSRARRQGLRFTHVVASGNQALLGIHDFVEYALHDGDTGVIVVVLEGLIEPSGFRSVLEQTAKLRKPVIACKIGRAEVGARAVTTHTGALAGNYQAYQAVFRRYGVQEAHNIAQLIDTACCFCHLADRLPAGRRIGILTPSGGAGILLADKCEEQGLEINELDTLTRRRLAEVLPPYASLGNPVDITAQGVIEAGYATPLKIMLASRELDAVVVVCATYSAEYIAADMETLRSIRQESDKPVLFCTYTAANPDAMKLLVEAGFPFMTDMQNCASALSSMVNYHGYLDHMQPRETQVPDTQPPPVDLHRFCERKILCEYEVKTVLADLGLLQPAGFLARTAGQAVEYFEKYASPMAVAMKIQSPDIPHKTDTGGVLLNLDTAQAVRDGFSRLLENGARYETGADIHGVLLEPMSAPGIEMLIGISPDKDFGLMLSAGAGGVLVEVMDDVAVTPVPVSESQARYLLEELKIWKLLAGYRGNEPADVTALINLMVGLSRFAEANKDHIREIELNPVIVHTEGQGLTVVDALVINRHRGRT